MNVLAVTVIVLLCVVSSLCQPKKENSACEDLKPFFCEKQSHLCKVEKFKQWMKQFCRKKCGFCEPGATDAPQVTYKPYTGKCGQPEVQGVRVIAGTTPPRGAWPWQILLKWDDFPTCGGTLIAPGWVVTAAHCVYNREESPWMFTVTVGEHDRTVEEGSEFEIGVSKVIRFPSYDQYTMNNDIAMLKLDRPVKLGKYVQPACFPSRDAPVGSQCYITGWGKTRHPGHMTNVLQQGLLPVVSNKVCYAKNKRSIHVRVTPAMICGGSGGTDRISGCHGDSGGPFVCQIDGKWELHGSVSYGSPVCKSTETYTVFSRTNYFKKWIKETMASH